jgi:hypothetical protein
VARAVRRDGRARRGIIVGSVAAETLEDTLALLRGLRVEIDVRIEQLGRWRSAEALLERARAENGGLPETVAAATDQSGVEVIEVFGTPGRLARRAAVASELERRVEAESGPIEEVPT